MSIYNNIQIQLKCLRGVHTLVKAIKLFLTVSLGAAPVAPVAVFADMAVEWK